MTVLSAGVPSSEKAKRALVATDYVALRCGGEDLLPPDWRAYRDALRVIANSKGALPEPPALKPWDLDVPLSVTPLQARKALRAAGLMPAVQTALADADDETREAWEYATLIERENALLAGIATGLGLTEEQLDELFRTAATL